HAAANGSNRPRFEEHARNRAARPLRRRVSTRVSGLGTGRYRRGAARILSPARQCLLLVVLCPRSPDDRSLASRRRKAERRGGRHGPSVAGPALLVVRRWSVAP